eukprot:1468054-Alexandrium_andersonii.AAC.1
MPADQVALQKPAPARRAMLVDQPEDLGDAAEFWEEVRKRAARWQPDRPATQLMVEQPYSVTCVVLGRPSGWAEVGK